MESKRFGIGGRLLIVPPILISGAILALLLFMKEKPSRREPVEWRRPLRVIDVAKTEVIPRVVGYGIAQPGRVVRSVSEVRGRVVEIHPELKSGAILGDGELLVRIDPAEYELAIARLNATIGQVEARLSELEAQEENYKASLRLEIESEALATRNLERSRGLIESGSESQSTVDQTERTLLLQQQSVQSLRNSIRLVPSQRRSLEADLEVQKANLGQARLDLAKTEIRAPFPCRAGDVSLQRDQFLAAGEFLFELQSLDFTEVEAKLPLDQVKRLIKEEQRSRFRPGMDMDQFRKILDLEAVVRFEVGPVKSEWPARLDRIRELVDPQTRTLGFIVAVDRPYEQSIPGKRPPLVKGMFCEVEFRGATQPSRVVIPRSALHGDQVYVVDQSSRLKRREVTVAFRQSSFVCLASGLSDGDRLIVSDPTPAIDGMLVDPTVDEDLSTRLLLEAAGRGPVR